MRLRMLCATAAAAVGTLAGCATAPMPTRELTYTEASILTAQQAGAREDGRAMQHLALARKQTELARERMEQGEHEQARLLLARARADAELAQAYAREHSTRRQADQALRRTQELGTP